MGFSYGDSTAQLHEQQQHEVEAQEQEQGMQQAVEGVDPRGRQVTPPPRAAAEPLTLPFLLPEHLTQAARVRVVEILYQRVSGRKSERVSG